MSATHYIATFGGEGGPVAAGFNKLKSLGHLMNRVTLITDSLTPQRRARLEELQRWFEDQGVQLEPTLPGTHNMREALPVRLQGAVLNVTGGTKGLALRVTDVALQEGRPVYVVDAHARVTSLRSLNGEAGQAIGNALSAQEYFRLSGQADQVQQIGKDELEADELKALGLLGLPAVGPVLFSFGDAHDAVQTENREQRGVLFLQSGMLQAVCLTTFPDPQTWRATGFINLRARSFAEFVRRHFGDTAEPGWVDQDLKSDVVRYLKQLGTLHADGSAADRLPPVALPDLPTLGRQVLLCVIGDQPMPAVVSALSGTPDTVLLVGTPTVRSTLGRVRAFLQARGQQVYALEIDDIKPEQLFDLTSKVLEQLGDGQLRLNISGGTKAMALNAYRAIRQDPRATTEYTRGTNLQVLRPLRQPEVQVSVSLTLEERLALFGLRAQRAIMHPGPLQEEFKTVAGNIMRLRQDDPAVYSLRDQLTTAWRGAGWPTAALKEVQAERDLKALRALLRGVAFELLTYGTVEQALRGQGAVFSLNTELTALTWAGDAQRGKDVMEPGAYRREIDVLVEWQGVLIVIEAKTRLIEGLSRQLEHFDAVELAQRLGGRYTHTLLVGTQQPTSDDLDDPVLARLWSEACAASDPEREFSLHVMRPGARPAGVNLFNEVALRAFLTTVLQTRGGSA